MMALSRPIIPGPDFVSVGLVFVFVAELPDFDPVLVVAGVVTGTVASVSIGGAIFTVSGAGSTAVVSLGTSVLAQAASSTTRTTACGFMENSASA
jgi:hypothetical protein